MTKILMIVLSILLLVGCGSNDISLGNRSDNQETTEQTTQTKNA